MKTEVQGELTQASPGSPSGEDSDDVRAGAGPGSSRGTLKEQGVLPKMGVRGSQSLPQFKQPDQ